MTFVLFLTENSHYENTDRLKKLLEYLEKRNN